MDVQQIIAFLNIDTLTLAVSGTLALLAVLSLLCSPFFRAVKPLAEDEEGGEEAQTGEEQVATDDGARPAVSVLLTPHDNAEQLTRHLEAYLSQDYPDYQVIVVTWKGDHETDDILKRYASNARLYTTYIPDSSRYMPREKLAVTIGVKAAKNEWVVLADIACQPDSDQWLATMARHFREGTNLVTTHTRYEESVKAFWRFERLYKELYLLREVTRGIAYKGDGGCLAFRKSEFMAGEGYRGNLKYLHGEYDYIINKYARVGSLVCELDSQAWLTEETPTRKYWRNKHLFYMENRQHLERSAAHRRRYNLHQALLHLNLWASVAAMIFAGLTLHWLLLGLSVLVLLVSVIVRTVMARKVFRAWSEPVSAAVWFHEQHLLWHAWGLFRRYRKSNKTDFISHKI